MLARGKITIYFTNTSFRWFLFFFMYSFIGQAQRATSAKHTANSRVPAKTFCVKILFFFRMKNLYCCCHSFGVIPKQLLPRLGHTLDKPLSPFTIMNLF